MFLLVIFPETAAIARVLSALIIGANRLPHGPGLKPGQFSRIY
jgi:hypothetical protein